MANYGRIFPYPKRNFRLEIDARQRDGTFKTLYSSEIDPDNYFILKETPAPFKVVEIIQNGKPSEKIDIQ